MADTLDFNVIPSYVVGADSHNIASEGFSWFSPASWYESISNVPKFASVSVLSGFNSFYNTGAAIGNFFGADINERDTDAFISGIDSNLGAYYQENKEGADLAGFIATSFIPGTAAIKALKMGQTALRAAEAGYVGTNMSKATGLLIPNASTYTKLAAKEIASSQAAFSSINGNLLKAMGAGVGQAALESAAFEVGVAATMFKSPILEDMDLVDLTKNIAFGTVLGGVIGGAFSAAKTYGKVKAEVKGIEATEKPFVSITQLPEGMSASDRLIARFDDLASIPAINTGNENAKRLQQLADSKIKRLDNMILEDVRSLVGDDGDSATMLYNALKGMNANDVVANMTRVSEVARVGERLGIEKEAVKGIRKPFQQYAIDELGQNKSVFYVKTAGEGAGTVSAEAPKYINLADRYKDATQFIAKQGFKAEKSVSVASLSADQAEARYMWASKLDEKSFKDKLINEYDLPMLERAHELGIPVTIRTIEGTPITLDTPEAVLKQLRSAKDLLADVYVTENTTLQYRDFLLNSKEVMTHKELAKWKKIDAQLEEKSLDSIAARLNVRKSYLEGSESAVLENDILARQAFNREYTADLVKKGLWKETQGIYDVSSKPQWLKFAAPRSDSVPFELEGMMYVKQKEKLLQQQMDNVSSYITKGLSDRIYRPGDDLLEKANRYGAGSGAASFANGNYGSLESWSEFSGKVVSEIQKAFRINVDEALQPIAYQLANNLDSAIEFQAINQLIARTTEKYVLDPAGKSLVARKVAQYEAKVAAGEKTGAYPILQDGASERIPIKSEITQKFISAHIEQNGQRVNDFRYIRAVQGLEDTKDPSTFYPIKPNTKDYPYFAFVTDDTVTGAGHVTMIHAADQKNLEQMITKIKSETKYTVVTKSESEAYHKAVGDYDFERTLHENYIDSDLKSRGINSQFIPRTDPKLIAEEFMGWHYRSSDVLARETIGAKFSKEFDYLRSLGEQYSNISTSKYASNAQIAETVTKNPYLNYVKTALNVSKFSEYPLLQSFNKLMDTSFSRAYRAVADYFQVAKTPEELDVVNRKFQEYGLKTAYYDAATDLLANHIAPSGELSKFVRRANGLLSTLTLRLDPLNAINNAVGHGVLLGAETRSVLRAIGTENTEAVGALAKLTQIKLPGVDDNITSAGRLIVNAQKRFFQDIWGEKSLYNFYKENGFISKLTDQFKSMIDEMTLKGDESIQTLNGKIDKAFAIAKNFGEKGEQITGNKWAEEFNRFVAADVMKQITDVAINAGVMDGKQQLSYISTFVNRTQGNMLASQRPVMFQGPIGQAIGLFQTYQFNLMQQMFRYVAEGSKKDAAMLLGLQGTIYGLNGLPGFDFVNKHIVGTASGNPQHRDLYDATYGVFGNQVADFLMYGLPSNILHANLYSRGDINPRHLTVVPVNPVDIPIYGAYSRFFGNLKDTATKIANGGAFWQSMLQGMEHNGLSRPLAGLAQELQAVGTGGTAFSTSGRGNILGSNDIFSIASFARIAGGRPFDEARLLDAVYRYKYYAADDFAKRQGIAEAVKSYTIGGKTLDDQDIVEGMLHRYVASGGKQLQFNQWMMQQMKASNTSQVNKMKEALNSPFSSSLQKLMGGEEYLDGRNM